MGKKKTIKIILDVLRKQQSEYGDLASIDDLISLINKAI